MMYILDLVNLFTSLWIEIHAIWGFLAFKFVLM